MTARREFVRRGVVTGKNKDITELMTDESNVDKVMKGSVELEKAFMKFQDAHKAFHSYLEAPLVFEESSNYYELVFQQAEALQENVDIWLTGILASNLMKSFDVNPEDSASNVGLQSFTSRSSSALRKPRGIEDGPALQKFSILLTSCSNTLREIGYLNKLENPESLKKSVERLPYLLRQKWRMLVDTISQKERRDPNLKDISEFVEDLEWPTIQSLARFRAIRSCSSIQRTRVHI